MIRLNANNESEAVLIISIRVCKHPGHCDFTFYVAFVQEECDINGSTFFENIHHVLIFQHPKHKYFIKGV